MKTIILVSSIFYLIGIKVSDKVSLAKNAELTPVVFNKINYPEKPGVNARFHEELKPENKVVANDSLNVTEASKISIAREKKKI
jgi:hypothetical protein